MSHFHRHPHGRKQFSRRSFCFLGASAAGAAVGKTRASSRLTPVSKPLPETVPTMAPESGQATGQATVEIFDAHLHCPTEKGEVWQWHPVTRTFEEFVSYLDRTGVDRGIINSVRSQVGKTPAEFVAGNREVARYVEKYKGRFLGACVVNPLYIDESLREIEECRRQFGFVWVGELCNYTVPYQYTVKEFELLVD